MSVALQHVSLCWLLHLAAGSAAILLGPWPGLRWLLMLAYVAALVASARLWGADGALQGRHRHAVALLAHAPGLVLSLALLLMFVGALEMRRVLMVYLQWWTAAWTPLLAKLPPVSRRNLYIWVTLAIPVGEWLLLAAADARARGRAQSP